MLGSTCPLIRSTMFSQKRFVALLTILLAVLVISCSIVHSLTPTQKQAGKAASTATTDVYRLVWIPGGTQYLPKSYVKSFPRWQIEPETNKLILITGDSSTCHSQPSVSIISVQPTVNFLLKGGVPSYVLAGLLSAENGDTQKDTLGVVLEASNTNYLAQQWTTFAMTTEPNFRMEVFLGPGDGTDNSVGVVDAQKVRAAVEQLGQALSNTGDGDLYQGFHIVTTPMTMDTTGNIDQQPLDAPILTCLATAEPDAREILTLDDALVEMTATSKLNIEATKVLSAA